MIENTILKANREGRKALVFSMTYKDLWAVEAAAQAGFDAISLDGEHGAFSSSDVDDIVRVANGYGMSVMARPEHPAEHAQPVAGPRDPGGGPSIETRRGGAAACRRLSVPPDGWRSWGGGRGTEFNDAHRLNEVQRQARLRPVGQPEHACAGPDRVEASA